MFSSDSTVSEDIKSVIHVDSAVHDRTPHDADIGNYTTNYASIYFLIHLGIINFYSNDMLFLK